MIETKNSINFIEEIIQGDINKGFPKDPLCFRFPPEPNGHLHIGHAKSICLNFGLAKKYKAFINLRLDNTNPSKEENNYIYAIKNDIKWLGFNWDKEFYSSDCFEKIYKWSLQFIQEGKAYIDELPQYIILKHRKIPLFPGIDSPYRNRTKKESLVVFKKMKYGKILEGGSVLRTKIDMKSPNMNLRDPIMFRILKVTHKKKQQLWNIYPTYDWTHGLSDLIEKVSHSICSLEFENHRPLYEWYLNNMRKKEIPKQIEFARLNFSYIFMSKRKLHLLVQEGFVEGWDDPRLPTIRGIRRRGYIAKSVRDFCYCIGISKRNNVIDLSRLEFSIREQLKKVIISIMAVMTPIKLVIENYPSENFEWVQSDNNPENKKAGKRKVPFSRILYIEREDFIERAPKNFHRLSIGKEVRLKNAYIVKGTGYLKDLNGVIIKISAIYDFKSQSGLVSSIKKIKGTLHWVDSSHSIFIDLRIYELLFSIENPDAKKYFNTNSLKIVHGIGESFVKQVKQGELFQLHRIGYFCVDQKIYKEIIILNRTVLNKSVTSFISK